MTDISPLVQYVRTDLYDHFAQQRKKLLETKWQKNIDAFNSISTGFWKAEEGEEWRSKTFFGITKIKVLAGWSLVVDMELQGGDIPFTLIPSPWDETAFDDLPREQQDHIRGQIQDMTEIIRQQLLDCKADRNLMKCIMSSAIYGETVGKRYVQSVERRGYNAQSMAPEGLNDEHGQYVRYQPYAIQKNAPAWEYVSVWSVFRDLETDDMQAGRGVIHKQMISPYQLRKKLGRPYYIDNAIKIAIEEAKSSKSMESVETGTLPPGQRDIDTRWNTIENLELWGRVPRSRAEMFEESLKLNKFTDFESDNFLEEDDKGDEIEVLIELADNQVVRYVRHRPNDRPFYRSVWEIKLDHVEANSIADNIEQIQTVVNGMVRGFEDNKKLSANVILAIKEEMLSPGQSDTLKPGLRLQISDECDDVRKAIQPVVIPDMGATLLDGIGLMERQADEQSHIPKLSQGFTPAKQKPDTAYELSQLLTNAGKYLGGVIKNHDEGLIEPIVSDFYNYNMEDPECKAKGNFMAKALGFTSYQDRVVRTQNLQRFLQLLLVNPTTLKEGKVDSILEEIAKSLDLEKSQVLKSLQEKEEDAKRQQQSPEYQAQMETMRLEVEKRRGEVEKIFMEARKMHAEIQTLFEELSLEREKLGIKQDELEIDLAKTIAGIK